MNSPTTFGHHHLAQDPHQLWRQQLVVKDLMDLAHVAQQIPSRLLFAAQVAHVAVGELPQLVSEVLGKVLVEIVPNAVRLEQEIFVQHLAAERTFELKQTLCAH